MTDLLNATKRFSSAFVAVALTWLALLAFTGLFISPRTDALSGYVLLVSMISSISGLWVLRLFKQVFSWPTVIAYLLIGFAVLLALNFIAVVVVPSQGRPIRVEVTIGVAFLEWIAFALPSLFFGKEILKQRS